MLATLRTLWERLSSLGIGDEPGAGERRRIRLTNQSAAVGVVSCASFALGYALAGPRYLAPLIANVSALVPLVFALVAGARGARRLSRVLVLLPVNLGTVVVSMVLGGRIGIV